MQGRVGGAGLDAEVVVVLAEPAGDLVGLPEALVCPPAVVVAQIGAETPRWWRPLRDRRRLDLDDAITRTVTMAIWFSIITGYLTLVGRHPIPG